MESSCGKPDFILRSINHLNQHEGDLCPRCYGRDVKLLRSSYHSPMVKPNSRQDFLPSHYISIFAIIMIAELSLQQGVAKLAHVPRRVDGSSRHAKSQVRDL
jgi:hypothetical protein